MILVGAKDVGPAHYLIALERYLMAPNRWVGSDLTQQIFTQHGLKSQPDWKNTQVKLVLTGTTQGPSLDKEMVNWARERSIPSVSVIEHWSWYRKRFEVGNELVLPDFILVNDQTAKEQAIAEGLPKNCFFVGGNPWLEKLSCEALPEFDEYAWRNNLGLPQGRVLVFITEALRDAFPEGTSDYLGYDEFSVLKSLIDTVPDDIIILIKLHPEEPVEKYSQLLLAGKVYSIGHASIAELALGANYIVGMASMLLLELAMYRDDVISFRPNARLSFIGNNIGATIPVCDKDSLAKKLQKPLQCRSSSFRDGFKGSGERIGKFLNDLMQ